MQRFKESFAFLQRSQGEASFILQKPSGAKANLETITANFAQYYATFEVLENVWAVFMRDSEKVKASSCNFKCS